VASTATRGVGRVHHIHKRIGPGETAGNRTINTGPIGGIRVTLAAIVRCGDVTFWRRDDDYRVMRMSIMTAGAIVGNAGGGMIEAWQGEAYEAGSMAGQTILPHHRHVRH